VGWVTAAEREANYREDVGGGGGGARKSDDALRLDSGVTRRSVAGGVKPVPLERRRLY